MAITIDETTQVITVEQSDLAFIVGTLYELDTNAYRLAVGALLASERYMWMDPAFNHNGEVSVAGTTFARIIEQTNGYSLTFGTASSPGPGDYILRWDATDKSGIGYLTDESTNDIDSWTDETSTSTLTDSGVVTNYPEWIIDSDGFPCVHLQRDGSLDDTTTFAPDDVSSTTFCVLKSNDIGGEASNAYLFRGWGDVRAFTDATGRPSGKITVYPQVADRTANDFDDRRIIVSATNLHAGPSDNQYTKYCGTTVLGSGQTVLAGAQKRDLGIGGYGGTLESDCNIYELLVWDRVLTPTEHTNVVNYLSSKWQATNADNAVDTFSVAVSYSVRLAGSNNNLFDIENGILVQNLVQVIAQNSAGLVRVDTGAADTTAIIQSVEDWGVINYSK